MRIAIFDEIMETHVNASLARALRALGHEVILTGKVWKGFTPPTEQKAKHGIFLQLQKLVNQEIDALLCMRSSSLTAEHLQYLRSQGVVTAVWFNDDPVLYKLCTAAVAPHYDITLHTGDSRTLALYEDTLGVRGATFPFWCDAVDFPHRYDAELAQHDLVFVGYMHNHVKRWRFSWLQEAVTAGVDLIAYGKTHDEDRADFAVGDLPMDDVAATLPEFRAGFNISQQFADYDGTEFDYPQLRELGEFPIPSRVVQFAAVGLPVITLRMPGDNGPLWESQFPEVVGIRTPAELATLLDEWRAHPEQRASIAAATYARWQRDFSADARARLLVDLLSDPGRLRTLSRTERATLFANYCGQYARPGLPAIVRRFRVRIRHRLAVVRRRSRRLLGAMRRSLYRRN